MFEEIVVALVGLMLLVIGFVGWWTASGKLTREEKMADALYRYKRGVNRAGHRSMTDLSHVRMEYKNERESLSERRR